MKTYSKILLLPLCFFLMATFYPADYTTTDPYPKNANIDALNYAFKIELSDTTEEIKCELKLDLQFLAIDAG